MSQLLKEKCDSCDVFMDKAGKWDVSVSDMKIGGVVCYSKGGNEFYAFEVKRERGVSKEERIYVNNWKDILKGFKKA